jgi:large repetitive protein
MNRIFSGGLRRLGAVVLVVGAIVGWTSRTDAASVTVSWAAPTTSADGTPLTDLAGYRVYVDTEAPSCPGGPFLAVSSPTSEPSSGQTVSDRITGLTDAATYFARITAVDESGNESACSPLVSGIAHSDLRVTPSTAVSFGSVTAGAVVDRAFTIENTAGSTLAGTTNVGAPFTITSGGSFSLAPGGLQTVVVRFQPTGPGVFAGNVTFTADGDTVSRGVSGAATGTVTTPSGPASSGPLEVFITQPSDGATVSGTDWAVLWVEGTSGAANAFILSVDGVVIGSQTTAAHGPVVISLAPAANGTHILTGTVRDAAGNIGSTSITITVVGNGAGTAAPAPPPAPEPPANDTLKVVITQPTDDATVGGTTWVTLWVEGTSGSANAFTLSVDGTPIGSETTSTRGPVTIPWTTAIANGAHTLTATVRDAAGHTGRTSISVTVRN